jgi:hypothetical protein
MIRWLGSGDPPHYDYTGSSSSLDVAREGLRAFQQLHNQYRSVLPQLTCIILDVLPRVATLLDCSTPHVQCVCYMLIVFLI